MREEPISKLLQPSLVTCIAPGSIAMPESVRAFAADSHVADTDCSKGLSKREQGWGFTAGFEV